MDTRIPVSLRVDTSSELYYSLVEPLRQNRDLSTFIITLLTLYLENDTVKEIVDDYLMGYTAKAQVEAHIQEIANLQGKSVRAIEDFEVATQNIGTSSKIGGNGVTDTAILQRLDILEKSVSMLVESLGSKIDSKVATSTTEIGDMKSKNPQLSVYSDEEVKKSNDESVIDLENDSMDEMVNKIKLVSEPEYEDASDDLASFMSSL